MSELRHAIAEQRITRFAEDFFSQPERNDD
jgi:hypothetical protein